MIATRRLAGLAMIAILGLALRIVSADEATLPIASLVKQLAASAPMAPPVTMENASQRVVTPTTPSGKLPQYQLGFKQRLTTRIEDTANPRLRVILSLPGTMLLVEASITIDRVPYQMIREQRVERLLKELGVVHNDREADIQSNRLPQADATLATDRGLFDRLRQSKKVTGENPSREEIHWILANWIDGPMTLWLNDNFQRIRAQQRPAYTILDQDRDGTVSENEMRFAAQSFQECDLNRDEVVDFTEIAAVAATRQTAIRRIELAQLITPVPDTLNAVTIYRRLLESLAHEHGPVATIVPRFDRNGNGRFEADEIRMLYESPADLTLSITFDTTNPAKSQFAITNMAAEFADVSRNAMVSPSGIELVLGGTSVILEAVQSQASDQVSIGAIDDGYPLLPEIDPNDDGRLTIRELRSLTSTLKTFDKNGDGVLASEEIRSPIRICFGLGPIVHRQLAGIRSVRHGSTVNSAVGPEWFVRLDRNKDHDLSRGEFPGTDEQFNAIDIDADQLISVDEAMNYDRPPNPGATNRDGDQSGLPVIDDAEAPSPLTPPGTKP